MIKVCHMTSGHDSKDGRIFHKQCRSLVKAGYDVYLVAPDGVDMDIDGVKIRSVSMNFKNRLDRMTKVAKAVYEKALLLDADIYHFHDSQLLPYGLKLKKNGKKVIFDSHEDYPAEISAKKWMPWPVRKVVAFLYCEYEKYALKKFDAVISVTPHIVERIKKYNSNTILVTNYAILSEDHVVCNSKKDNVVCYVGRITEDCMHENILSAFEYVENTRYLLAGFGDEKYIQKLKNHSQWDKVNFMGEIKHNESRKLFSNSLVGIVLFDYTPNTGYKMGTLGNTKFFGYLEAGLPVICTDFVLWKEIVDKYKCGICVNPHDVNAISDAINYFVSHPNEASQMGKNGRAAVIEKYNWETQAKELIKLYASM